MCDWSDDASDVERYHVEVYYMSVGGTGQLEETQTPWHTEDIRPPHNSFRFTCTTSGVYSIQLTVYDRANHSARARQIFNYDANSKMTSTVTYALLLFGVNIHRIICWYSLSPEWKWGKLHLIPYLYFIFVNDFQT